MKLLLSAFVIISLSAPLSYNEATGERILITSMGFSHIYGLAAIGRELQKKGHQVMYVAPARAEEATLKAVGKKERSRIILFGESNTLTNNSLAKYTRYSDLFTQEMRLGGQIFDDWCGVLTDTTTMAKVKTYNPDFILVDFNPALPAPLMLPYALNVKYGVRSITLHTSIIPGLLPSWYPQVFDDGYTDRMNFMQRLRNTITNKLISTGFSIYSGYRWSSCADVPFLHVYKEFPKDVDIILMNTDLSVEYPIPLPPKVVFIGGAHIQTLKPLPNDLEEYLKDSKGAIYLSIGSENKIYPRSFLTAIIYLMDNLSDFQLILTLNDTGAIDHPRITTLPHAPQNDILGHSKVQLFISHCGTNSQMEAIYNAKPILCIPVSRDQFHNAARTKQRRMGLVLPDIWQLSGQELFEAVTQMLSQPSYLEAARALSSIFHEQPIKPAERGAHWIDHVVRHGSEHLQFPAMISGGGSITFLTSG